MDLYIYYHAAAVNAASVQAAVASLQQHLRSRASSAALAASGSGGTLRCGLKRRPSSDDSGRDTWMEIYLAVTDSFHGLLDQALAETALLRLIDGDRHVEIFVEALPCA